MNFFFWTFSGRQILSIFLLFANKGSVSIKSHVLSIVYIKCSSSRYSIVSVIQLRISPEADISVCRVLSGIKVRIKSEKSVGQYTYWIFEYFWRKNIFPTSSGRKSECVELSRESIKDLPWVRKLFPVPPHKGLFLPCLLFAHVWRYCKIPKISPGAYIFQRPFLRGLFLEGLIFGGAYLQREICFSKSIELAL